MPEGNHQKIKLLKIMELLRRETDEQHPIKRTELCKRIQAMGITCDPRTLSKDIALLNAEGYEIMTPQIRHDRCYYVDDRSFSIPELKILIDAVQAASFITEEKSSDLINKIAALGSNQRAELIKGNIIRFNTRKHSNETIYYSVGFLEEAILKNLQVMLRYFDLNENGQRIYRKNGASYTVEPVALVYNEDNYYLIAYNAKYDKPTHYRVDRMEGVELTEEPVSEAAVAMRSNMDQYTDTLFKMYTGDPKNITLRFDEALIGAVYDKFGEDTKMKRIDEHTIEASVSVRIAPTFWGWLFQFGEKMRIAKPACMKETYLNLAKRLLIEE